MTTLPADVVGQIEAHRQCRKRADAAFGRYFAKRQAGEPTNGAAWQRLENVANEAWTNAHNAISRAARSDDSVWLHPDADDYL
jgi:hypothetical protein